MKVLSLLPRSRFTESGMTLPETLSLHFLPPNGSHVLIAAAESAQALLLPPSQPYVDAFCLERMPSIRFIQTTGAGFDSVDHLTAAELGIPVSNSPNMNASSVAEYVMAAIVNLQRGLAWADGEIRRGRYAASRAELLEQGGLEQRAGQRCLPAGAGRGRHHHSGERYGLMFHGSSSSQWVPRILIIAALQTKCNLRIQTFLPFPGPIQKAPRKKEGDPPRTCSGTPVSRRGRRSPHGIGWCGGAILQSTQGGILH